jgi:DNA-binding NtrC family response regulator
MKDASLQSLKTRYGIVGFSDKLENALNTAIQVAGTDLSVLIQGESGVGKEILPRIIHEHSRRSRGPYIAINCGSIPEGTIDSELFGHEKGAFTGAVGEREGYFGAANGGTLFLDEVGELPLPTQARLLRVLETGEFIRVGSSEPRKTDVRIVAATNVDMATAIRNGRFREDLFYRLSTISIKMPPLRERGRDAVLLFKKFALETAEKYNIPQPLKLTPEGEEVVKSYQWPGNVRQLKNIAEQMSILSEEREIGAEALAKYDIMPGGGGTGITRVGDGHSHHDYDKEITWLASAVLELRKEVNELKEILHIHKESTPSRLLPKENMPQTVTHSEHVTPDTFDDIETAEEIVDSDILNLEEMEKRNIVRALERNNHRRGRAAEELGISERTLYRKIKEYGIEE